jgi:hypothetical protein
MQGKKNLIDELFTLSIRELQTLIDELKIILNNKK